MSSAASYWCYRCTRMITLTPEDTLACPHCKGEFIEAVNSHVSSPLDSRRRYSHVSSPPAVESMPVVHISDPHVSNELHCAVCKEAFVIGTEMPCHHVYHSDCIIPWLSVRNSCPVCRHEHPTDSNDSSSPTAGLTVRRLPGGGLINNSMPRRIVLQSGRNTTRGDGGFRRAFGNTFSFIRRTRSTAISFGESTNRMRSRRNGLSVSRFMIGFRTVEEHIPSF
ncbi:E3 ubiquitin-protein ligase RDUF2-like [Bidens hawaiensis]|uniref:E3 ubiquitin-protein ligase RDUF2-like n=1 Tax=Bidens hawaiensis TaxID=980011 RepID=UPI00404950B4